MDTLKPDSLDWALTHIERFGDTDIFPIPFEYAAIKHSWVSIRDYLSQIDLSDHHCNALRRFLVPKPSGGFRVATQLDPFDTIIYTAMIYEAASLIESYRIDPSKRIACSYRVGLDSNGRLFNVTNGWGDYQSQAKFFSEQSEFPFVVQTDISDFYNQISHHRVRNALESANVDSNRAKNIENFLMELTGRQSRGLPVGQSASILLAEICLNDVDNYLLRKSYNFTRYVDDFRIFCKSKKQAIEIIHNLSEYLNTSHRLTLASNKTRILSLDKFVNRYLLDSERIEQKRRTEKISEILEQMYHARYDFDHLDIEAETILLESDRQFIIDNLVDLFHIAVNDQGIQLGLIRYLLRRATAVRTNRLYGPILDNLDSLTPVIRDVVIYFQKTLQTKTKSSVGERIIKYIHESDYAGLPYIQLWLIELLIDKFSDDFEHEVRKICEQYQLHLGKRPQALLSQKQKYIDWIRIHRETWQNNSEWDRRSIIWSASSLSADERKHWLERIKRSNNRLDTIIAIAALGMN